jgi:hypothetical protein
MVGAGVRDGGRGHGVQTFVGDCTLVPPLSPSLYTRLFSNPDAAALRDFMASAERLVSRLKGQGRGRGGYFGRSSRF